MNNNCFIENQTYLRRNESGTRDIVVHLLQDLNMDPNPSVHYPVDVVKSQ